MRKNKLSSVIAKHCGKFRSKNVNNMATSDKITVKNYSILTEDDVPGAKLKKDPESCIVDELKRWLECHGLKKSGKKAELVERVKEGLKTKLPVSQKIDGGRWYELKLKKSQEGSESTPTCSYTANASSELPNDGWRNFPSRNIPANFNYGHVYFYLVESVASAVQNIEDSDASDDGEKLYDTCDTVTAKPLRKGRNLLRSGDVHDIHDNADEIKHEYYIRAHVHHSMKGFPPLNVSVTLSNVSGNIKSASCDCKASALDRCVHVAALLLHLSDYASNDELVIQPSTSKPCPWNKGKKREKIPTKLHQVDYKSRSSKRKPLSELYNFDPRPEDKRAASDVRIKDFVVRLQSDAKQSMWETILKIKYENWKLDEADATVYKEMVIQFAQNLSQNNADILNDKVCGEIPGTDQQANSDRWHLERKFRITASKCQSAVMRGETLDKYDSLLPHFNWLYRNFWFPSTYCNQYMKYGIDNEQNALREYSDRLNVLVGLSGLWINDKYLHLAASPDGLIFDNGKLVSIVEVK